jgi:hypothetical protein
LLSYLTSPYSIDPQSEMIMNKIFLSLLFSLSSICLAPPTSQASPIFTGEITHKSVDEFISKYDGLRDIKEIIIFSQGGEVGASIKLGQWVYKKNLDVVVRTMCYSGCANYVFVAGRKKILEPDAFVAWHGDVEQKDFRELARKYEEISSRKEKSKISKTDQLFLETNKNKYRTIKVLGRSQAELYSKLKLNSEFGRIGQEPVNYPSDGWILTKKAMAHFGILNVVVPDNYATVEYLSATPLPAFINGGPFVILDVDNSGNIIPVNLAQINGSR